MAEEGRQRWLKKTFSDLGAFVSYWIADSTASQRRSTVCLSYC